MIPRATQAVIDGLRRAGDPRLAMIGGGGSLLDENGERFVDQPGFPSPHRAEALAQGQALALLRGTPESADWTYLSPPPQHLETGDAHGGYVVRRRSPRHRRRRLQRDLLRRSGRRAGRRAGAPAVHPPPVHRRLRLLSTTATPGM